MGQEYARNEMLSWLESYFKNKGYKTDRYSTKVEPVRVPLLCKNEEDELVVDLTTNSTISKDDWFNKIDVNGVEIVASSINFYRYYFIKAKIYLAYPAYVVENDEFNEFKKVCMKNGIGLLKVSKNKRNRIKEVVSARLLYNEICNQLGIENNDIKKKLEYYLMKFLHYFVYYPEPVYKRRAITGRMEGNISFILIDKLGELENIAYKDKLIELSSKYRQEARDDYEIALETIKELWLDVSDVKYPEIQRQLEDILLRNTEYRDHFLHQFMVFLLGAYIIDKLYDKECINQFNKKYKCKIEMMWLLASTYHDFNYSIQQYKFWSKEFFNEALNITGNDELSSLNLDAAFIRENFLLKTTEICKELDLEMNHIVTNFFYEQAITKRNHGLLSALSLLKLFENSTNSTRGKINRPALVQAAIAVALHDENIWKAFSGRNDGEKWSCNFANEEFLQNMKFQQFPLGFLLIFCDTAQEWGRVGKNYKEALPRLENLIVNSNKILVNISVKEDKYHNEKQEEIQRVKNFLTDAIFEIQLDSREGGLTTTLPMKGR